MAEYAGNVKVKPCRECGRKFVPESLAKHEPTCIQNAKKKRKVFDSSKQRATEDLSVRQIKQAQKKQVTPPKTHWKQKHQEFIANIRAAKGAQVAIDRGDPLPPPPPPSLNPDYITCPYCSRRFNEKAAERHISFCKDQQKRLPAKRQPTSEEKARAAARQKYAAQQQGSKSKASVGGSSSPSGGYSQTGGGYSQTGGGYSQSGGGYSQSGGSYNSPAGRTTGGSRSTPASKPEAGRTPNSGGYGRGSTGYGSSAGKTTATRGRSTGSNQPSYQASDYADIDSPYGEFESRPGSGRALRTGRDVRTYEEAMRDVKGPVPRTKATPLRGGMRGNLSTTKNTPPTSGHGGYGGMKESESGYYSSSSENDISNNAKLNSASSRFCHECGSKYPLTQAKFCCECGTRRMAVR